MMMTAAFDLLIEIWNVEYDERLGSDNQSLLGIGNDFLVEEELSSIFV